MKTIDTALSQGAVIPVLEIERVEDAISLCEALFAGGLRCLEVTLRTSDALAAIKAMKSTGRDLSVGAGTVLDATMLSSAAEAGADFIVSPGLTEALVNEAEARSIPFLPGAVTASEVLRGLQLGLKLFKFFPAESAGGANAVAALGGPFAGVRFCPTGGIRPDNAADYLALPNVRCVGGSWVAPPSLIREHNWIEIETRARAAANLASDARS